jgi:hypothetical protein
MTLTDRSAAAELDTQGPDGPSPSYARRVADGQRPDPAVEYVTEISIPSFGDDGIQRLHSHMRQPEPLPEPEAEPELAL